MGVYFFDLSSLTMQRFRALRGKRIQPCSLVLDDYKSCGVNLFWPPNQDSTPLQQVSPIRPIFLGRDYELSSICHISVTKCGRPGWWGGMVVPYLVTSMAGHMSPGLIHAGWQNRLHRCRAKNILIPGRPRSVGP